MGYPWVKRHPQSNLVSFLILEMGFDEMFEQSWSHYREEYTQGKIEMTLNARR